MKKALDRLRCWLIRKLGGFVFPADGTVIQAQSRKIVTFTATRALRITDQVGGLTAHFAWDELSYELASEIRKAGFIQITREDRDPLFYVLRATVRVVEPEESAV